jgi:hypothetical protein
MTSCPCPVRLLREVSLSLTSTVLCMDVRWRRLLSFEISGKSQTMRVSLMYTTINWDQTHAIPYISWSVEFGVVPPCSGGKKRPECMTKVARGWDVITQITRSEVSVVQIQRSSGAARCAQLEALWKTEGYRSRRDCGATGSINFA